MRRDLILGPPGTGKTTTLLEVAQGWLEEGLPPELLGFATYTRAARREASERFRDRLHIPPADLPWLRTIHSACSRALGLTKADYLTDKDLADFGKLHRYDMDGEDGKPNFGALLMGHLDRGRALMQDDNVTASQIDHPTIRRAFLGFAEKYRDWGRQLDKLDFTGVLEAAVAQRVRLPVSHLIVDEAQDLSPLQVAALSHTIAEAECVTVAGDDDQAIFEHAGSDPSWLLSLAADERWGTRVLARSWRVPRAVHARAQRVISRNRERVEKDYAPTDREGRVGWITWHDLRSLSGDVMCLARTRALVKPIAETLHKAGLPYIVERGSGPNPLGRVKVVDAVQVATDIGSGKPIDAAGLSLLLELVPASRAADAVCPWGTKTKARDLAGQITTADLRMLGLGRLVDAAKADPVALMLKLSADDREYLQRLRTEHGEIPKPTIRLSTIHSVKGREAEQVVINTEIPKVVDAHMANGGGESERRVAYVALTRAKQSVSLLPPLSSRGRAFPY